MFNPLKFLFTGSKSSRAARLVALESGGWARWTPRDYAALACEGYARNAIVYRAVRLIAESIGALCFVLYEGTAERDNHPLLDLVKRPNPRQDGASLLETVAWRRCGNVSARRRSSPSTKNVWPQVMDRLKAEMCSNSPTRNKLQAPAVLFRKPRRVRRGRMEL